jgi:hypothetical protein
MGELREYPPAFGMDRVGDDTPPRKLFAREQAWHVNETDRALTDPYGFAHQEARRRTLPVVLDMERRRHQPDVACASARH